MAEPELLQRLHERVLQSFIERGHAPTYLEVGQAEQLAPDAARAAVRELVGCGLPGVWQHPGTDHIASYAPFNNLPTWHRVTVAGEQKWTAQCGFEALAVTHVFPGQEVVIDSSCLDCGEPVQVRMRDGELLGVEPAEAVAHVNLPLARWFDDFAST